MGKQGELNEEECGKWCWLYI